MIRYTVGNILESPADAIINTVNCEGYMGKGIAYQFKIKYPENNRKYVEECNQGDFKPGTLLTFKEAGKIIINFPTKDQWRKKSEYSYITSGLNSLTKLIPTLNLKSIAFPPLGCGNGGLDWNTVKDLITNAVLPFQTDLDIIIYEPSNNISQIKNTKRAPKLNTSHLILMHLKLGLNKFNKTRLQKAAFLVNIFSGEQYFKFNAYNYGPYTHTIDILSRDIKEYQQYFNFSTEKALETAENTLMSDSVIEKLVKFQEPLLRSIKLLNYIETDREIELLSTILFILTQKKAVKVEEFPTEFLRWSEEKASKFSESDIINEIEFLKRKGMLIDSLLGVELISADNY
jgi:O-acetyl-ADP-ribose deacetylase (regulator of RNase III)